MKSTRSPTSQQQAQVEHELRNKVNTEATIPACSKFETVHLSGDIIVSYCLKLFSIRIKSLMVVIFCRKEPRYLSVLRAGNNRDCQIIRNGFLFEAVGGARLCRQAETLHIVVWNTMQSCTSLKTFVNIYNLIVNE